MATDIEKFAREVDPTIPGISWDKLVAQFKMPPEQIVYDTTKQGDASGVWQYQKEMIAAFERAKACVAQINLPWDIGTAEAIAAWNKVKNETAEVSADAMSVFKQNVNALLPEANALFVSSEDMSAIIASLYQAAMYSAIMHGNLLLQIQLVDAEAIVENAEDVTKAFNTIVYLFEKGSLDALKKNATNGLGIPVIVGVIIAVAAVAAIGAIAWTMVASKKITAFNKVMDQVCSEAMRSKDPKMMDSCLKLADMSKVSVDGGPSSLGGPFGDVQKLVWLGLGAYVIFLAAPYVVPMIAKSFDKKSS